MLQKKAKTLSKQELDLKIAELSYDIDFLEQQVQADLKSYSSEELSVANVKIVEAKQKLELFKTELAKRGKSS